MPIYNKPFCKSGFMSNFIRY